MSRFEVDKLIWHTDDDGRRVSEFARDPGSYVGAWVERGVAVGPRSIPDGGLLTPDERAAFESEDWGALYAMGAHPYLLFHFVLAIDMARGPTPWPEFVEWYRSIVAPHGRPDFTT